MIFSFITNVRRIPDLSRLIQEILYFLWETEFFGVLLEGSLVGN
jgi:hypothetical protein